MREHYGRDTREWHCYRLSIRYQESYDNTRIESSALSASYVTVRIGDSVVYYVIVTHCLIVTRAFVVVNGAHSDTLWNNGIIGIWRRRRKMNGPGLKD